MPIKNNLNSVKVLWGTVIPLQFNMKDLWEYWNIQTLHRTKIEEEEELD